jgi:hypothetical protein
MKLKKATEFATLNVTELKEIPQDVLGSLQVRQCGIGFHIPFFGIF